MTYYNNIWLDKIASYGDDVRIDDTARINRPELVTVGSHIIIDFNVYISVCLKMKDWIHIAPFASVIGGGGTYLYMGHFTSIAAGGRVICATDDFKCSLLSPHIPKELKTVKIAPVILEDFSCLGTNAVCISGITLAMGSVIGAGGIVTKDTEPWGIYVGVPAKLIGYRDKENILENAQKLGYEI